MGFYKISLVSGAFSHLMKALKDKNKIVEIDARREWYTTKNRRVAKDIPYLTARAENRKGVRLSKHSPTVLFDPKKVIEWLHQEDVQDLAVDNFSLLVKNDGLREVLEKKFASKIPDNSFIIKFAKSADVKVLDSVRRLVVNNMKFQVDNLGFKLESLDMIGIWHFKDYLKDKEINLLDDVKGDKEFMKNLCDSILNEFILIEGKQSRIRAIKYYEMGTRDLLILKDADVM